MAKDRQTKLWIEEIQQKKVTKVSVEEQANKDVYRKRFVQALHDPVFRKTEGFPFGADEAFLDLSALPDYAACSNPFVAEWLAEHATPYNSQTDNYLREPFAADVSEGKNNPIYNAQSYHTKVPHKAIMRYILHYTNPGDVVFDGFCGTGMTGVAASLCGDKETVESLGYRVDTDGTILHTTLDNAGKKTWTPFSHLGSRKVLLNDLSPAATFIAQNYNHPANPLVFEREVFRILDEVETEYGWMYRTIHTAPRGISETDLKAVVLNGGPVPEGVVLGTVQYIVWSDVFVCPNCSKELIYWDVAIDKQNGKVLELFSCPSCNSQLSKGAVLSDSLDKEYKRYTSSKKASPAERAYTTSYDRYLSCHVRHAKQAPVLINYAIGNKRFEKRPDTFDLLLIEKIEKIENPYWFPFLRMPEGDEARRNDEIGMTHVHHYFTKRNQLVLSALMHKSNRKSLFVILSILNRASRQHQIAISRIGGVKKRDGGATAGHRRGTLYVPSNQVEFSVIQLFRERIRLINKTLKLLSKAKTSSVSIISTESTTSLSSIPDNSIDYIFIDPPFGYNLMYSELNFIFESFLQVFTNSKNEAIINKTQKKGLKQYEILITDCMQRLFQILKPGRWMTVEFHNTKNSIWDAIQKSLLIAGFIISEVRTLDKKNKTHTQRTSKGAANHDLVISAYKPHSDFVKLFESLKGRPEGVFEFLVHYLSILPVVPLTADGCIESIAERTRDVLFERMVAYHLVRNVRIPLSSSEFYQLLDEQFVCRDDMYFLPDQAVRYDVVRVRTEVEQIPLFIRNERSAVQWVRTELEAKPQTLGELTPKFMQAMVAEWDKMEERVELIKLLKEYFVRDSDERWRVPDPNRAKDMDAIRRKTLLKIFEDYAKGKSKMKVFRREAVLEGFRECWETKQYSVIVAVCERLPASVLQESPDIKQFYEIARDRVPQQTVKNTQIFLWEV
ncbi:MAG: site-specific DNA-methyltransferase [Dehalobacter sp.]|nr:site-specific DNA-methyltransferase [Dehalobacter sp.]